MDASGEERKYRIVANELRDNILAGRYLPGEAFPSVKMLCRRFGISHLTAAKVIETLKGMGLVKTRSGVGTFVARRMKFIGLIVPMLRHVEIFPPIIRELSRLAQSEGVGVDFVDISSEDPFGEVDASVVDTARRMAASSLSGVIFHPVDFGSKAASINGEVKSIFEKAGIPLVLLDADSSTPDRCPNLDFVGVDNREIGETVGRHVIEQGARSVAFVTRSESGNVRLRLDGLLSAVSRKRGAKFAGRYLWQDNDQAVLERKLNARLPDAIVCSSDLVAANVLKLLKKIGKRCPQDVLVAGVNDVDLATLVTPSLTTVHQPCKAIAKTAFETLLWRMANPDAETRRILVAANLVVRESTTR